MLKREFRRRTLLAGIAAILGSSAIAGQNGDPVGGKQPLSAGDELIPVEAFQAIEIASGGELGVFVLDLETGRAGGWNATDRFPLNSTFKLLLAAAIVMRAETGLEDLDRDIPVRKDDIVTWSPVLEGKVGTRLSVRDLCAAMMTQSDNAAANLLLASLGGPDGLTAILRSLGDPTTRIDRFEPDLNDVPPGDLRDTTTPEQMVRDLERFLVGDILSGQGRALLRSWMVANTTGSARIRAGVPAGWIVGDRTGTGRRGETATIAAIWPPDRKPLLMAVYLRGARQTPSEQSRWHADLARIATSNVRRLNGEGADDKG